MRRKAGTVRSLRGKPPTYMTFGEAEWVPGIPPTTLDLREGIAVFTRDGVPPLLATISPLVVMTRALTHSIPRYLKELTGEVVSITSVELQLDRLLRHSGELQLRGYEWLDGTGISASSATSDQNLQTPPEDFINRFGEAVTAYRMIWEGLDMTLRRDFSLDIATVDASLQQIVGSMTRLIPQLIEFRVLR
jgi:hypothetical protein